MLSLLRRSPALRLVPVWAMLVGLTVSFVVGILLLNAAKTRSDVAAVPLVGFCWLGVSVYLLCGRVRSRCSDFDTTLPISARRLWLIHVFSVALAGAILIGVIALVVMIHATLPVGVELELEPAGLAAYLLAGLLLAVSLMAAYRPSLARVAASRAYLLRTTGVLALVLVLLLLIAATHPALALFPVLIALVIGARTYRALPEALTIAPFEAEEVDGGGASAALTRDGPTAPSRWIVWTTAFQTASAGVKDLMGLPLIAIVGVLFGGVLDLTGSESDFQFLRFTYLPLATYLLFALFPLRLARLHHVDFLPLSRRVLFAVIMIPLLFAMWLGYGLGFVSAELFDPREDLVTYAETRSGYRVAVPLRFMEVAWDGEPLAFVAPWGESHPAAYSTPFLGSKIAVYSPYSVKEASSREYVALQISRAVEAVYGASIPPEQIAERYVESTEDGGHRPKGAGLTLRRDFPELEPRSTGPLFPVLIAIVLLPFLLLSAALLRCYRADYTNRMRLAIYWGFLGVLLAVIIFAVVALLTRLTAPWLTRSLVELPVQWMGESIVRTIAAWVVGIGSLVAAYLYAEAQFRRMEIPVKPPRYALIDWL